MNDENRLSERFEWLNSVSVFRNNIILKQLGMAIGIPFGILILFLLVASRNSSGAKYALGLIVILFVLTYLLIMILWKGKYDVKYILDTHGIQSITQEGQRKKNRMINAITISLGLISRNYTVAGAGMLANSRQKVFIDWKRIKK
ncbi:MAG: hypothetical protein JW702_08690 [Clostridiales bacterium]|nr:hypothetical protein [Clostridiales bacterium]